MALYPDARHRLIRPGASDPPIDVIGAILHVDAGDNVSLFNYFNGPSGGIESHFHVTNVPDPKRPGFAIVEQYRDTGYEADANHKANSFYSGGRRRGYVSIETQGKEYGKWSDIQVASIKALLVWLSKTHDFPLEVCKSPTSPGVGYHTMWGAPSQWTPVAKSCPGPDRKKQFREELVPWMEKPGTPTVPEEDPMAVLTKAQLDQIRKEVWHKPIVEVDPTTPKTRLRADFTLAYAYSRAGAAYRTALQNQQRLIRIEKALAALAESLTPTVRDAVKAELAEALPQIVDVDVQITENTEE